MGVVGIFLVIINFVYVEGFGSSHVVRSAMVLGGSSFVYYLEKFRIFHQTLVNKLTNLLLDPIESPYYYMHRSIIAFYICI